MTGALGFFHSGAMHVPVFEAMVRELAGEIPMRHAVRADLLERAQLKGVTLAVQEEVVAEILGLVETGAAVVVCTCSTLAPGAELAANRTHVPVLRIDRPMVERALDCGRRILIVAALASTLAPTRELVERVAAERRVVPLIRELVAEGAWPLFEAGNREDYARTIAAAVRPRAGETDVVILAQASMAPAAALLADLTIPVLASPRLGLEQALALRSRRLANPA